MNILNLFTAKPQVLFIISLLCMANIAFALNSLPSTGLVTGSLSAEIEATGDRIVAVKVDVSPDVVECYLWNAEQEGSELLDVASQVYRKDDYAGWTGDHLVVRDWDLGSNADGKYVIKVMCRNNVLASQRMSASIIKDATPPEISNVVFDSSTRNAKVSGTFDVTDLYEIEKCTMKRTCPVPNLEVECQKGTASYDENIGYTTQFNCDTPELELNGQILTRCEPNRFNELKITCNDVHGNANEYLINIIRFSEHELGITPPRCDGSSGGITASIETDPGLYGTAEKVCKQYDPSWNTRQNIYKLNDDFVYFTNDDILIPIMVQSTNLITGCAIDGPGGTWDCDIIRVGSDGGYTMEYLCATKNSRTGNSMLNEGSSANSVSISCTDEVGSINPDIDLTVYLDQTEPENKGCEPQFYLTNGGHGKYEDIDILHDFEFAAKASDETSGLKEVWYDLDMGSEIASEQYLPDETEASYKNPDSWVDEMNAEGAPEGELDFQCIFVDRLGNTHTAPSTYVSNEHVQHFCRMENDGDCCMQLDRVDCSTVDGFVTQFSNADKCGWVTFDDSTKNGCYDKTTHDLMTRDEGCGGVHGVSLAITTLGAGFVGAATIATVYAGVAVAGGATAAAAGGVSLGGFATIAAIGAGNAWNPVGVAILVGVGLVVVGTVLYELSEDKCADCSGSEAECDKADLSTGW